LLVVVVVVVLADELVLGELVVAVSEVVLAVVRRA